MVQFGIHAAPTTLSQLVERAQAGEEIVIARNGTTVVRLVPITEKSARADVYGALRGRVEIAPDFDELPDDIADAFGAR